MPFCKARTLSELVRKSLDTRCYGAPFYLHPSHPSFHPNQRSKGGLARLAIFHLVALGRMGLVRRPARRIPTWEEGYVSQELGYTRYHPVSSFCPTQLVWFQTGREHHARPGISRVRDASRTTRGLGCLVLGSSRRSELPPGEGSDPLSAEARRGSSSVWPLGLPLV